MLNHGMSYFFNGSKHSLPDQYKFAQCNVKKQRMPETILACNNIFFDACTFLLSDIIVLGLQCIFNQISN